MPHVKLTTTCDLIENSDIADILSALVQTVSGLDTVKSETIKGYHSIVNTWVMGEGAPSGFAHCELSVLTGRNDALRKRFAEALFAKMRELFAESLAAGEATVSVELREMDAQTYLKTT